MQIHKLLILILALQTSLSATAFSESHDSVMCGRNKSIKRKYQESTSLPDPQVMRIKFSEAESGIVTKDHNIDLHEKHKKSREEYTFYPVTQSELRSVDSLLALLLGAQYICVNTQRVQRPARNKSGEFDVMFRWYKNEYQFGIGTTLEEAKQDLVKTIYSNNKYNIKHLKF